MSEDISQQKRAEQRSDSDQYLLDLAGQIARIGGWEVDLKTGEVLWSDTVCEIHEVPRGSQFPLERCLEFYLPEWRRQVTLAIQHTIETGVAFDFEAAIRSAKGNTVWVRAMGELIRDSEGQAISLRERQTHRLAHP